MSEQMSQIQVKCTDQVVKIVKAPVIASGGLNEVSVVFDFCEKWDGFVKTALFYRDTDNIYYAVLDDNDTCVVPWEVCYADGYFFFSVFGEKGNVRRTSNKNRYRVVEGAITEGFMPSDPTPDVYDQIIALVAETKEVSKSFREEAMEVIAATKAATADAEAATGEANTATANAVAAKENAENAAMQANTAKEAALEAKESADAATMDANSATTAANSAAASANAAAEAANTAAQSGNEAAREARAATTNAESATVAANNAASVANKASASASTAATSANNAATAANTATTKAEEATVAANNAASVAEAATEETIAARDSFLEAAGESMQAIVDLLGAAVDGPAVVCEETGSVVAVGDASNRIVQGLTLYGKTTQDGTPTPESPVELVSAGNGGSIGVTLTDGTDSNVQTLTAQTPNGLPGIPVTSGGNYTDENGQQWICDEIDFARGVYVKRIVSKVLNASESWNTYASTAGYLSFRHKIGKLGYGVDDAILCDKLQHAPSLVNSNKVTGIRVLDSSSYDCFHVFLRLPAEYMDGITNVTTFKQWLAENPLTVLYALAEPVETPLSAEELAQYAALHTYKPETTVYNDAGAGMKIAYVADTKLYIDKKFNELAAAIVNNA